LEFRRVLFLSNHMCKNCIWFSQRYVHVMYIRDDNRKAMPTAIKLRMIHNIVITPYEAKCYILAFIPFPVLYSSFCKVWTCFSSCSKTKGLFFFEQSRHA